MNRGQSQTWGILPTREFWRRNRLRRDSPGQQELRLRLWLAMFLASLGAVVASQMFQLGMAERIVLALVTYLALMIVLLGLFERSLRRTGLFQQGH